MELTRRAQWKLFRYSVAAFRLCIRVLMLSSGMVASAVFGARVNVSPPKPRRRRSEDALADGQTVMTPAAAPAPKVSMGDRAFVVPERSCSHCLIVEYDVNRTALLAPCFMICGKRDSVSRSSNEAVQVVEVETHGREQAAVHACDTLCLTNDDCAVDEAVVPRHRPLGVVDQFCPDDGANVRRVSGRPFCVKAMTT